MAGLSSTPKAVTDGDIILATIDIVANRERIYQALTTKEMENWWGEDGIYHVKDWEADLRPGGQWTLNVVRPDGTALPASGEFLVLDPPNKFVITRRYDWDYPGLGRHATRVAYTLDAIESGTRVTIRQEDFNGCTQAAYEHAPNWERLLSWLRDYAE
jgi:uncharacterized protein YndB with AHSA1/START domain